jgi:hypothetical protein
LAHDWKSPESPQKRWWHHLPHELKK